MRSLVMIFAAVAPLVTLACGSSSSPSSPTDGGGSDASEDVANSTDSGSTNSAACPSALPLAMSACSTPGLDCSYVLGSDTGPDGAIYTSSVKLVCQGGTWVAASP